MNEEDELNKEIIKDEEDQFQKGKVIAKNNNITYSIFKDKVSNLHTNPEEFEEEEFIFMFRSYCCFITIVNKTIEEWCNDWFKDWNLDKNTTMLISNLK